MRPIDADAAIEYIKAKMIPVPREGSRGIVYNAGYELAIRAIEVQLTIDSGMEPVIDAVWQYYTNDEGKARWRCTNCGKVCHKNPHDKRRCSICGAHMSMEA